MCCCDDILVQSGAHGTFKSSLVSFRLRYLEFKFSLISSFPRPGKLLCSHRQNKLKYRETNVTKIIIKIEQRRKGQDFKLLILTLITYSEPPVFSLRPSAAITVPKISSSVRINCSAKGSPSPEVTWYKNNISMYAIKYVTKEEMTSELVIEQFQPSDQGTYTCVARTVYNNTVETSSKIGEALCLFSDDKNHSNPSQN